MRRAEITILTLAPSHLITLTWLYEGRLEMEAVSYLSYVSASLVWCGRSGDLA